MGIEIDRETFTEADHAAFRERLTECLAALREVLARPGFGEGPTTVGAELELDLVDGRGRPARVNRAVLGDALDPRVCLELNRYNLEINARPTALRGAPFAALTTEFDGALRGIERAAAQHGARPITIGILPTLTTADLDSAVLSDRARYRALSRSILARRGGPLALRIDGADPLALDCDDVTAEGANTSLQLHLRVAPRDFARVHAAAQIATAPALALAGNAPLFLGHRLWEETRVALFRQSTDDRAGASDDDFRPARVSFGHGWVREGAYELFAESVALHEPLLPVLAEERPGDTLREGRIPALGELRLHHGTVWRWNRAVYDDADGGHLRIELRALPAGPTLLDMMANGAFLLGLTLALAPRIGEILPGFLFGQARRNFYRAAERGLAAELLWPMVPGACVAPVETKVLLHALLPVARAALEAHGVSASDVAPLFTVLAARVESGQTGAVWQRRVFERARERASPEEAAQEVVARYLDASATGRPVHTWSTRP